MAKSDKANEKTNVIKTMNIANKTMIKNLFNDLKLIGKKRYFFKNGDEELYFVGKGLTVEIANTDGRIDIVIEKGGARVNYLDCYYLSESAKCRIATILNLNFINAAGCRDISRILLDELKNNV